ncbi:RNA methyltransferase [Flammeovirgaceae bacterium SG7u.111]|nr:RNA methyltransferase [Flammeovirgaceae bacterium SG7u.132]WPO35054.1 RNA methyltransferase [Flammeovirgaceae bacterium SG7u.111]
MEEKEEVNKSTLRKRADEIKEFRCKNLIAVLEEPNDYKNIGKVIRNINALGVEKLYIVDSRDKLPDNWQEMRNRKSLTKTSVSAIKWTYVKKFKSTEECLEHLEKKRFVSIVTSPHLKSEKNVVLNEGDYTQIRLAVWFGNESRGVSKTAIERSEMCVSIPMYGIIESLNLATSTGIVLYEVTTQRREFQKKYKRGQKKYQRKVKSDKGK